MLKIVILLLVISIQLSQDYLKNIDPNNKRKTIQKIQTTAKVTVSDGLTYSTQTLFIDHQRAIFKQVYTNRKITLGLDGKYVWTYDESKEDDANQELTTFILGHQFHALILKFKQLFPKMRRIEQENEIHYKSMNAFDVTLIADKKNQLKHMIIKPTEELSVHFEFDAWENYDEIRLPRIIKIDDGQRKFTYTFTEISFNKGEMNDYRAPLNQQTSQQQLMRLHRQLMDDHLFERATTMVEVSADSTFMLSNGAIYRNSGATTAKQFAQMMGNRDYLTYDDKVKPIIHVSEDGSLGWVMAQVYAKGVRLNPDRSIKEPLEFTTAWVELYKKVEGRWTMVGNVSNFATSE